MGRLRILPPFRVLKLETGTCAHKWLEPELEPSPVFKVLPSPNNVAPESRFKWNTRFQACFSTRSCVEYRRLLRDLVAHKTRCTESGKVWFQMPFNGRKTPRHLDARCWSPILLRVHMLDPPSFMCVVSADALVWPRQTMLLTANGL